MIDIRTFKVVESSFDPNQIEVQNQSLKKSNTILFGIIVAAILIFVGAYIVNNKNEKDN